MSVLTLIAPLGGWAAPLDEVPDPVFAQRMMGEGVAIDPTGELLYAPAAGVILKLHPARHAVTLRTQEGAEVLVHLGLETVALAGEGFTALVADGEAVEAGQPLIRFQLDRLAQRAPSLLSPVVVTNPEAFDIEVLALDCEVAVGAALLALRPRGAAAAAPTAPGPAATRRVRVRHAHGLHARPAARISAEARRWRAEIELRLGPGRADARSPVQIITLAVGQGAEIELAASGPDAEAALRALAGVIDAINAEPTPAPPAQPSATASSRTAAGVLHGVAAAPGLAVGPAWRWRPPEAPIETRSRGASQEMEALEEALAKVQASLEGRMRRLSGDTRAVAEAHLALLEDPALAAQTRRAIAAGASAGSAWRGAVESHAQAIAGSADERIAERAGDLKDLEQQVLWALAGRRPDPPAPPRHAIIVADDLLPSEVSALAGAGAAGLCTARGGPTSHVAILAGSLDLPAVVAAGEAALETPEGAIVILDGDRGLLESTPGPEHLAAARNELARRAEAEAQARAAAAAPAETADGTRIAVFANVGSLADAEAAVRGGAEGCGLLRTEFLFLDRESPPTEDEQAAAYEAICEAFGERPVIVRTLDVGGDKPAAYLDLPLEDNPALGLRGVRVSLARPQLLDAQLRAILRARPQRPCRIMLPMVASVAEVRAVRANLDAARAALGVTGEVQLGVMVETPAAAAAADLLAPHADFFSIGTNDLAQYALAMDRTHPGLGPGADALHPAVLRLVRLAAMAAAEGGRPLAVCGGLASDPAATAILIGLGVTELSVAPARAPVIKARIRSLTLPFCRDLARAACNAVSAEAVRSLAAEAEAAAAQPQGARP